MPQLTLQYSSNVKDVSDFSALFAELHDILVDVASATLESCKSRAVEQKKYYIGDGNPNNAFIHVEVLLAEGRTLATRQEVGRQILEVLKKHFSKSLEQLHLQITVEPTEFQKHLYFKISS